MLIGRASQLPANFWGERYFLSLFVALRPLIAVAGFKPLAQYKGSHPTKEIRMLVSRCAFMSLVAALAVIVSGSTASATVVTPYAISGGSYMTNVIRRFDASSVLTSTAATSAVGGGASDQFSPNSGRFAIDGNQSSWQFFPDGGASGTARLTVTLDQTYKLSRVYTEYEPGWEPGQYQLRLSTDATNWTTVRNFTTPFTGFASNYTFAATDARYIEYTWLGERAANGVVSLREIEAFADATGPVIKNNGGYNLAMTGTVTNPTPTKWSGSPAGASSQIFSGTSTVNDGSTITYVTPNGATQASPAQFVLDLGAIQELQQIYLSFVYGQSWTGGSVEISGNGTTWSTVLSQTTTLGSMYIPLGDVDARYVRVSSFGGGGALGEIEVIGVPEPTSAVLVGLSLTLCATARRRCR
jgi:hypothetical protein